jgi:Protein of unknown function (DUF4058)
MPIHDWTRVSAGIFHAFHCVWIGELQKVLNTGLLPPDYYALAEQTAGEFGPDVLTLQASEPNGVPPSGDPQGATAVALAPPRVRFTVTAEEDEYVKKRRTLTIRHSSDDRVVALIEILSPGNKDSRHAIRAIVRKAIAALQQKVHLLIVDLHPPTPRDPQGIHGAIWGEFKDDTYQAPADKPLTLVSYEAGAARTAYIEPVAVGDVLPDMPLFLTPGFYTLVPLEATYQVAWSGMPMRTKRVLEG